MINNNNKEYKMKMIFYFILCLIPLIGAFIGIVLISIGFKKDKKLIFIGSFGILFTLLVYFLLFFEIKNSKNFSNDLVIITKKELVEVKNNLYLYKIKNGKFPNNLEELKLINESIMIEDPFLIKKMDKKIKTSLEYQVRGNKYILFSVGIDGRANTTDDIR